MAKLKNYSGADMAKELNDVYGKVDLDYAREFDDFNAEQVFLDSKTKEQVEDINELITGRRQGT